MPIAAFYTGFTPLDEDCAQRVPGTSKTNGALGDYWSPCPVISFLQRLQVLDQIGLLLRVQPEHELPVVVLDHVAQRSEAAVVEEAALLVRPQSRQRGGAILAGRRAVGLEGIDSELGRRVQVVPRFREERRNVAGRALAPAVEDLLAQLCGSRVETSDGRLRRLEGELIGMKRGKLGRDEVGRAARIPRAAPRGHRILDGIAQALVEESPRAVHLRHGDVGVPVRHRAEARPRVEVHAGEAERGRNQRARLPAVRTEGFAVLVELGVEAPGAPAVQYRLYRSLIDLQQLGDRGEVGSERNDESDVQVAVGPAVEALADSGRKGVVDGRVAQRALDAQDRKSTRLNSSNRTIS